MRDVFKPGRGGDRRVRAIPDVQTLSCPAGDLHTLANDAAARTYCSGCRASWADLDAEARATAPPVITDEPCPCGTRLISQWIWRNADAEQRAAWLADGLSERRGGQCTPCYKAARKAAS